MKILFSLARLRPQMEVATVLLAIEIATEFAVQNPVAIDIVQWSAKRQTGDTALKMNSRLKELKGIGFIEYARSGTEFMITRGDSFAAIYHNRSDAKITEAVKKEVVKAKAEPPLEQRYRKFRDEVMGYKEKYSERMLEDFIAFWSESKAGKMKWETDFFSVPRRLATWHSNQKKFAQQSQAW